MTSTKRIVAGTAVAVAGIGGLSAAMIPLRSHLSPATTALVLVIPVVAGVAIGGFPSGLVAVAAGFVAYDYFFIPPYNRLAVTSSQDWVALVVYVVVMLVVARVFSYLQAARAEAERKEEDTRRLSVLSDNLIADKSLWEVLDLLVATVSEAFGPRWVAVLLPASSTPHPALRPGFSNGKTNGATSDRLQIVAQAGEPITDTERANLQGMAGRLQSLGTGGQSVDDITRVALTAWGRPVGLLALSGPIFTRPVALWRPSTPGPGLSSRDVDLLRTYANQAALAIERNRMRDLAVRTEALEEIDRWRAAMMGAVSHDLRTPLASVKAAVSALRDDRSSLSEEDRAELLELIEAQSDRLERLVANLLDMTRLEAGALTLRRQPGRVGEIVADAVAALGTVLPPARLRIDVPDGLPLVDVDQLLMTQALANLLQNAERYSPDDQPIEVSAAVRHGRVEVSVRDHGPGVDPEERGRIFAMFNRVSGGGRAGLGLTIAKAFIEAHGQHIRVEDAPGGGACFVVTMPLAGLPATVA